MKVIGKEVLVEQVLFFIFLEFLDLRYKGELENIYIYVGEWWNIVRF